MRIIPALAGNTSRQQATDLLAADHPRSRGEYQVTWCHNRLPGGSSPLSRGILGRWSPYASGPRIIPALAGNTGG
mgnify:CR=1 FL=1